MATTITEPIPSPPPEVCSNMYDNCMEVYKKYKKIIICVVMFFILCMLIYVPHYTEYGTYTIFGTFYTKNEALQTRRNQLLQSDYIDLEERYKNIANRYDKILDNYKSSETNIEKINKQNDLLKSKLNQQENFIREQSKSKKSESKAKDNKKTIFSDVSKTIINNERPQIGNMFSKNIKQHTS